MKDGCTPLYIAALNNRVEIVKVFITKGANKHAKPKVRTMTLSMDAASSGEITDRLATIRGTTSQACYHQRITSQASYNQENTLVSYHRGTTSQVSDHRGYTSQASDHRGTFRDSSSPSRTQSSSYPPP